ncbi:MAG: hypothetical protein A2163_07190 [Actinobacteria bacterium RBG_13_35_12]|nr:MAG: hypothetical protein A2163_07190 [Actinobacteria bacterium RBG_13_35_12]
MIYIFDIDNTVCKTMLDDYANAEPNEDRIKTVNKLYDDGNKIIYFTGRGTETGIDWEDLTLKQLKGWNCKFSELIMGKPYGDFLIDDKAVNSEEFFK